MEQRKHLIKNKILGITSGDPAGIGIEVAIKAICELDGAGFVPLLIASEKLIKKNYSALLDSLGVELQIVDDISNENIRGKIFISDVVPDSEDIVPGKGTMCTGIESRKYIDRAIKLWKEKRIDAVVTGPVSKSLVEKTGVHFMGHTEYFAENIGEKEPYMMMYSDRYSVILSSTHHAVFSLEKILNEDIILNAIVNGANAIRKIKGREPKIAVAGLDPHCGDDGAIGMFDKTVTSRSIDRAKSMGIDASGPYSADTLFIKERWEKYDLIVAQYHDQGLIPFKMQAFEEGVNVTLGISMVRTSVDHGTAFDIAGKGIASHRSMIKAMELAVKLL